MSLHILYIYILYIYINVMGPNGVSHEIKYHYLSFIIYAMFMLASMAIEE